MSRSPAGRWSSWWWILAKLELRDRVQLVVFAYEHGLARPGGTGNEPAPGGRAAWVGLDIDTVGCSWCVDFGTMLRRLAGLDADQLKEIGDYATSPKYTDDERAAIAYADAMTTTHSEVTDDQVVDLERRCGRAGVIELTYQIAHENTRARMYSALGITEQGFNSGDACRVPWANR